MENAKSYAPNLYDHRDSSEEEVPKLNRKQRRDFLKRTGNLHKHKKFMETMKAKKNKDGNGEYQMPPKMMAAMEVAKDMRLEIEQHQGLVKAWSVAHGAWAGLIEELEQVLAGGAELAGIQDRTVSVEGMFPGISLTLYHRDDEAGIEYSGRMTKYRRREQFDEVSGETMIRHAILLDNGARLVVYYMRDSDVPAGIPGRPLAVFCVVPPTDPRTREMWSVKQFGYLPDAEEAQCK